MTTNNISTWRPGGHQDWIREQQRLDAMRVRQEFALDVLKENDGIQMHQAAFQIAALQLCDLLADFDPAVLKVAFQTDANKYTLLLNAYTRLLTALPKLSAGELNCERRRDELAEREARVNQTESSEEKPGLTTPTLRKIETDLNFR